MNDLTIGYIIIGTATTLFLISITQLILSIKRNKKLSKLLKMLQE